MEQFKLDIFSKDHPESYLRVETLASPESEQIIAELLRVLRLDTSRSRDSDLFEELERRVEKFPLHDRETIDLIREITDGQNSGTDTDVFLIWGIKEAVDRVLLSDLLKSWEYIWYDVSDEAVVLLIPQFYSLLLATDHGYLGKLNPFSFPA
ncbi:MAG: hypothetical protein EOO09_05600 [Chitinophagaceae bacterium]|nr:MAG: hypothetical protein EOO09_05600 [Chitinophagaceae bacterium]